MTAGHVAGHEVRAAQRELDAAHAPGQPRPQGVEAARRDVTDAANELPAELQQAVFARSSSATTAARCPIEPRLRIGQIPTMEDALSRYGTAHV